MSAIDPDPRTGSPPEGPGRPPAEDHDRSEHSWTMRTVRYILPATVVAGGVVVMALGSEIDLEGGGGIVSAGLAIFFINWLFRIGASGDREREAEDAAREHFDRHGRWPD